MQLRECLDHGAARLSTGPHPDRARRDAESLLIHLTGKNRAWLLAHTADELGGCTAIRYAGLLDRRFAGEPIQYITGETEFFGLPFRVTPDVLIPRPETEHLVEAALALAKTLRAPSIPRSLRNGWDTETLHPPEQAVRVVDIGTGSGAIAVALAHSLPRARITAIDLSPAALEIAEENARRNGVADRIRFLRGDLLEPVARESFDFVVSNPPYVPETDRPGLSVEVRDYEPAMALFAGNDGLDIYRRLIPAALRVLRSGGVILLEIGFGEQEAVSHLLAESGFENIEAAPDLQGIPRVVSGRRADSLTC
jgi:release factor glutamine methyltransferase